MGACAGGIRRCLRMEMKELATERIKLRAVEPIDASMLFIWENNPANWKISHTEVPFSMHNIHQLIEQFSSVRTSGQLRMIVDLQENNKAIGAIDLYDVNFKHGFATLGILIADTQERGKGYAFEAISLFCDYCREVLSLNNLQCFIHADNEASIQLFEKLGWRKIGVRKNWYVYGDNLIDELAFQLCLKK